ncbi:MarR family winged helix-turn-helix transcriptional regulator [Ligilactobacillus sp. WILCCON 0076]|uniref:MarR family winged helix-turn-helix transcriptional regulator n=1 Tax=Ligilactobacillus ubinensis TaxID=2876789 RepID=A0A9X2FJ89_9LACO|nr:MarR family winged helix-turn-helix transcriptional regulator [Ligilactobacillus ubinensis]MCP0886359.1 MarR family winged helix-turn-helix transcriptional regulator [Ligilactobacillus ubinensis]
MDIRDTLGFQIKQLSIYLSQYANHQIMLHDLTNITEIQQWVLSYLYAHKEQETFQSTLQQCFGLKKSTVSELITRMQKNGLVTLATSSVDGRRKTISLTPYSLKKAFAINSMIEANEIQLQKDLTEEELTLFIQLSKKIKNNITFY